MLFVPDAGIRGKNKQLYPIDTVECDYLSLPMIPGSGTQVFLYAYVAKHYDMIRIVIISTIL